MVRHKTNKKTARIQGKHKRSKEQEQSLQY